MHTNVVVVAGCVAVVSKKLEIVLKAVIKIHISSRKVKKKTKKKYFFLFFSSAANKHGGIQNL